MISSFEKYIKAAIDAKKYSVVCEMANIVHSDKNRINIMTYPGKDVRVYKNRDDEVQILCPKNISYVQESNLTKAISTGTIFDNADDVDKYAGFIVKTKMPIDAMTNKGLENPYKLREVVGSTIGVMNEDGEVDVSDADVDNGNNIIDDLLKKDSKEFKDVKNVVDDYLDNDDHSFGYDTDFTYDIQQLRDEINRFKDADIAPEDSITDADWDDNWGSTSSIMGDHTDAEDEENEDDDLKRSHADDDLDIADDDDEDENPENITQEAYDLMVDPGEYIQEGAIYTLKKIGYNPLTKTFVTDIPVDKGPGAKMKCKIKFVLSGGACFHPDTQTIDIPIKELLGNSKLVIATLKHEEGHFYVSLDRSHFNQDFANAEKLVDKVGKRVPDHDNAREEYVADLYSANKAGAENSINMLKQIGFENRRKARAVKQNISPKKVKKLFDQYRKVARNEPENGYASFTNRKIMDAVRNLDDIYYMMKTWNINAVNHIADNIAGTSLRFLCIAGPGEYAKRHNDKDDTLRKGLQSTVDSLKSEAKLFATQADEYKAELQKLKDELIRYRDQQRKKINDIKNDPYYNQKDLSEEDKKRRDRWMNEEIKWEKDKYQSAKEKLKRKAAGLKAEYTPIDKKLDEMERMILKDIHALHASIDKSVKVFDDGIRARIYFIRKYTNTPVKESYSISPPPAYKMNPNHKAAFLNTDDDNIDNDTDVSYNMKKECGDGSISSDPSSGGNVNTTMEEDDTTTPMPAFSSGSGTDIQTESDEVDESFTPKAVVPDDLDEAPSDGHNPLLSPIHEGFMMKRPKKLKAIDIRGIVSYVTIEMNDIKDANDQAMIAGYVCSKLELIDFYITVLDTHDDRYVVPHTRQYLVDGQRQLSDLLTRILKIRPINRADRIWQIEKII